MEGGIKEIIGLSTALCIILYLLLNNMTYIPVNSAIVGKNQTETDKVGLFHRVVINEEIKDGFDVVVLHGLFSNSNVFKPFGEGLLKANNKVKRVILVDLRNHGLSDHHDSMKYIELANDVDRLIEKLEVQKYILVSHSMGAKTAMVMSMQKEFNYKIKKLVILDTFPIDYQNYPEIYKNTEHFLDFISKADLSKFTSIPDIVSYISKNFQSPIIHYFVLTMDQNLFQYKNTGQIHWRINVEGIQKNLMNIIGFDIPYPKDVSFYTGPLLVLLGADSIAIDVNFFLTIYPNYDKENDLRYIKDSKHWIHIDALEDLIKEVSQFINKI